MRAPITCPRHIALQRGFSLFYGCLTSKNAKFVPRPLRPRRTHAGATAISASELSHPRFRGDCLDWFPTLFEGLVSEPIVTCGVVRTRLARYLRVSVEGLVVDPGDALDKRRARAVIGCARVTFSLSADRPLLPTGPGRCASLAGGSTSIVRRPISTALRAGSDIGVGRSREPSYLCDCRSPERLGRSESQLQVHVLSGRSGDSWRRWA